MRPLAAEEGCLSDHNRRPQGLKPVSCSVINVRAEARTLQRASGRAVSEAGTGTIANRIPLEKASPALLGSNNPAGPVSPG